MVASLQLACSLGNQPIAECLIAHGALIMARDHKKRTALSHAAINGQEHCAAMLLAKGADFLKVLFSCYGEFRKKNYHVCCSRVTRPATHQRTTLLLTGGWNA